MDAITGFLLYFNLKYFPELCADKYEKKTFKQNTLI